MKVGAFSFMQHLSATDCKLYPYSYEKIYKVLSDLPGYAQWWPWGVKVKVLARNSNPMGEKIEVWASGGWFRCEICSLEPSKRVGIQYYQGVVLGETHWTITPQQDGQTKVCYTIDLELNGILPKFLGTFINFSRIHSFQFRRVLDSLDKRLRENA
ncbi:SRPBCC family protein [Desulfitobacterium sp. AusDCA]